MRSSLLLLAQIKNKSLKENRINGKKNTLDLQSLIKFQDFKIIDKFCSLKFSVYLIDAKSLQKRVVIKLFPFENDQPSPNYKNEMNCTRFSHPNIISILSYHENEKIERKGYSWKLSYVLMEYAPYGTLLDLIKNTDIKWDDILVRSYFHQLIEGIESLHSQKIAHLDLKPANLLIGEDFVLKIADFDSSYDIKDKVAITSLGTTNCRAPELLNQECQNPEAADIYSAGIILFLMKSGGILPFPENSTCKGEGLYDLLHSNSELFWKRHLEIQNKGNSFYDPRFQSLICLLTKRNPNERAKLEEIKNSKWYQGQIYSQDQIALIAGKSLKQKN